MNKVVKYGDIGTPERHKRKELTVTLVNGQPKTQVRHKSPVEFYYNRKQITAEERAAGEALHRYFTHGWIGLRSCEYREAVDGGGKGDHMSDRQVAAQKQFKRGMDAISNNHEITSLVRRVCIDEDLISDMYKNRYVRKQAMKDLRIGLMAVARVYHFAS